MPISENPQLHLQDQKEQHVKEATSEHTNPDCVQLSYVARPENPSHFFRPRSELGILLASSFPLV